MLSILKAIVSIDTTSIIDLQFYEFTSAYPLSSERPMKIKEDGLTFETVSYTHLTLPTIA